MGPEALKWCTKCTNMVVADETTSLPFLDPVPEDTPQYFDLIKKPMDLSTIQAKLKGSGYRSISGFIDDMLLIAENCRKYNGKDSNLGVAADAFETLFRKTVIENIEAGLKVTKKPLSLRKLNSIANTAKAMAKKTERQNDSDSGDTGMKNPKMVSGAEKKRKNLSATSGQAGKDKTGSPSPKRRRTNSSRKKATASEAPGIGTENGMSSPPQRPKEISHSTTDLSSSSSSSNVLGKDIEAADATKRSNEEPDMTEEDRVWCEETLDLMTKHPLSLPFLDPVDSSIESYHKIIENPMDFSTMARNMKKNRPLNPGRSPPREANLARGLQKAVRVEINPDKMTKTSSKGVPQPHYTKKSAFLGDLRLIFSNCKTFNAEGSDLYADALELEKVLERRLGVRTQIGEGTLPIV